MLSYLLVGSLGFGNCLVVVGPGGYLLGQTFVDLCQTLRQYSNIILYLSLFLLFQENLPLYLIPLTAQVLNTY